MAHWLRPPDPRLARFVEAYAFSDEAGEPDPPRSIRVVPDGCVDLLVSVECGTRSGRAHVFGTKTRALLVEPGPPVDNLAVRFRPGAAARFLRASAASVTDTSVELAAFWGDEGRRLVEEVAAAPVDRRAEIVERALLGRLAAASRPDVLDAATEGAVARLVRSGGRVRVRELAAWTGVGQRRLERAFRDRVGVSPKRLARILRFRQAYAALSRGAPQAEVALSAGYFDQAHLLRDFRALAGAPSSRVLSHSSKPPR